MVEPALRGRLLESRAEADEDVRCGVHEFRTRGGVWLWVEEIVEIRRRASHGLLPFPERLSFEVRFQVWRGPGYREFHVITVRPQAFDVEGTGGRVESWRVIRYEVTGWQSIHEHSSSGGPVR